MNVEKIICISFHFPYFSSPLIPDPPSPTVARLLRVYSRAWKFDTFRTVQASTWTNDHTLASFTKPQKKNVQRFAIIKIRCSTILLSERKFFPRFRQEFASTFASDTVRWCTHHNINNHSTVQRTSSFVTTVVQVSTTKE